MKTKTVRTFALALLAMITLSFGAFANKKPIDTAKSNIHWVGKKVTGQHDGSIDFKSGSVELKDGKLTGGTFVVDMTTINVLDLKGGKKGYLEKHLKGEDFFGVKEYAEAIFTITSVNGNKVMGDLTIKGHTEKESFVLMLDGNTLKGDIKVNRTKYGITYKSATFFEKMKDKAINDEFDLSVKVVF